MKTKFKLAIGATLVAGIVATAFATAAFTPGAPPVVGGHPAPPMFGMFFQISTGPIANGGYGDLIVSVREGRDDTSPYAAIEVLPGAGAPPPRPANVAAFLAGPAFNGLPAPVTAIAGTITFIYRPMNDTVNPGWAAPIAPAWVGTAGPGQLESMTTACHQFAEAVRQAVRFQNNLNAGTVPIPLLGPPVYDATITMALGGPLAGPAFGEFYKYDIITREF